MLILLVKGERVVNGEETTPSFHFGEGFRLSDVRPEAKAILFPKHSQSTLFQMPYPHPTPMRLHLKHLISSMCRSHIILPLFVFRSVLIFHDSLAAVGCRPSHGVKLAIDVTHTSADKLSSQNTTLLLQVWELYRKGVQSFAVSG